MEDKITLCGDNCSYCPRFIAKTEEELKRVAELWYRIGLRDHIVPLVEIACEGCSSHKTCTYHLVECIKEHNVNKCKECSDFPCDKLNSMLERSREYQEICKQCCSKKEYEALEKAFFHKEENLKK